MVFNLTLLDIIAFVWFLVTWVGYTAFARYSAKNNSSGLSRVLYGYRAEWVQKLSKTGMSEVDAELLASLEKQVSFFASTSLLILASLVTVLSTASDIFINISTLPFFDVVSVEVIQLKLMLLIVVFVYAFFTFTWSIRQYGFCFIMFGSSFNTVKYYQDSGGYSATAQERDFVAMGKVLDRAAHSYNYGLRAYYFAMAVLAWFVSASLFILACAATVFVLYRREFKSRTLKALVNAQQRGPEETS